MLEDHLKSTLGWEDVITDIPHHPVLERFEVQLEDSKIESVLTETANYFFNQGYSCLMTGFSMVAMDGENTRMIEFHYDPNISTLQIAVVDRKMHAEEMVVFMREQAMQYLTAWEQMADHNERVGVYEQLAKFLNLQENDVWIDFGMGLGNLARVAYRMNHFPFTFVGVDNNPEILDRAASILGEDPNVRLNESPVRGMMLDEKAQNFSFVGKPHESYRIKPGHANIFMDDFTDPVILEYYLERQVDVITYICEGFGHFALYADPYTIDIPILSFGVDEPDHIRLKREKRMAEVTDKSLNAAFGQAKRFLKPGGRFIYAKRADLKIPIEVFQKMGGPFRLGRVGYLDYHLPISVSPRLTLGAVNRGLTEHMVINTVEYVKV